MPFGVARLHSCEDEISAGTTTSGTVALLLPLASASFATRDAMTTVPVAESRIARATARGHTDSASLHNDLQRATDAFLLQSRNAWMKSKQGKAPDAPPNSARVINTHCHRDGSFAGREGVKSKTGVPPAPSKAVSARLVGIRATRPVSADAGQVDLALNAATECRAEYAFCVRLRGYVEYAMRSRSASTGRATAFVRAIPSRCQCRSNASTNSAKCAASGWRSASVWTPTSLSPRAGPNRNRVVRRKAFPARFPFWRDTSPERQPTAGRHLSPARLHATQTR